MAVSYSRTVLSQTGTGHFSPIAAYDPKSDQVLILDTARFKYGAHWTKLELLYDAMKPIDPVTGKSRGYALLSFADNNYRCPKGRSTQSAVQPMSLLFLTKLSQSPARAKYKDFLESLNQSPTLDMVFDYWTKTPDTTIWDILEPLIVEDNPRQRDAVNALHQLIEDVWKSVDGRYEAHFKELLSTEPEGRAATGGANVLHSIFVVFLSSLEEESRLRLVQQVHNEKVHSDLSIDQLLNEAALIATAIELSDQNDTGCNQPLCSRG